MKHTHKPNQNSNTTEPIIIIVPGHATIDTTKTIHQLIEVLDHISGSEGKIIIVGAGIHEDKDILHHHQLMQEGAQEANVPVVGTIERKLAQAQECFPNGLGNQTELIQSIDVQLIARMESEDWSEQAITAAQKDFYHQQKKSAKYFVPKTQSAKKASNKPYRQRKK